MSSGLGRPFDRAQSAREAEQPPENHNCKEDGHRWKKYRVAHVKGEEIVECKCSVCGELTCDE